MNQNHRLWLIEKLFYTQFTQSNLYPMWAFKIDEVNHKFREIIVLAISNVLIGKHQYIVRRPRIVPDSWYKLIGRVAKSDLGLAKIPKSLAKSCKSDWLKKIHRPYFLSRSWCGPSLIFLSPSRARALKIGPGPSLSLNSFNVEHVPSHNFLSLSFDLLGSNLVSSL